MTEATKGATNNAWDQFWFAPESLERISSIRGLMCLVTAVYFASAWSDVSFWFGPGQPFSPAESSAFWTIAGLEQEARWNLSPLFLSQSPWVYHGYLLAGIALAGVVASGKGGRATAVVLWLWLVAWANRLVILSGLTETLLSLGLFASAIAPPAAAWGAHVVKLERHWTARLATRLLAAQITLVAVVTFATMLGGRVWFNGLGAYAMAAPSQDRTIDWTTEGSWLVRPTVHESLTHLMVIALPLAVLLAWHPKTTRLGKVILLAWCATIALLGSLWLYAAAFAVMVLAIGPEKQELSN